MLQQARRLLSAPSHDHVSAAVDLLRAAIDSHCTDAYGELAHTLLGGLGAGVGVICLPAYQAEAVRLAKIGMGLGSPLAASALGRCYLTFGATIPSEAPKAGVAAVAGAAAPVQAVAFTRDCEQAMALFAQAREMYRVAARQAKVGPHFSFFWHCPF